MLRDLVLPFTFDGVSPADLGTDVLEIGPGPGLTTDLLAGQLERVTAIEIDPALASALEARAAGTNVEVVHADATDMPFEDGRFTGAATFSMLHHVPTAAEQDAVFSEMARVLRPGALVALTDSMAGDDIAAFHVDDVFNPVDPGTVADRLGTVGFVDVVVRTNEFAWAARARRT